MEVDTTDAELFALATVAEVFQFYIAERRELPQEMLAEMGKRKGHSIVLLKYLGGGHNQGVK